MGRLLNKPSRMAVACMILLGITFSTEADVLYMKNGRAYIGQTLNASGAVIKFRARGRTMTLPKSKVRKISYGSIDEKKVRKARAKRRALWLKKRQAAKKKAENKELVQPITKFDFKEKVEKRDVALGLVSPWLIAARSAVIPGWGHIAMDEPWLGWGYMAAFGALVSNTLYQRNLAERARLDYRRSVAYQNQIIFGLPGTATPAQRVALAAVLNARDYDTSRRRVADYNSSLALLFGFYAFQLLHAGYDAFRFGEDANWDVGFLPETPENSSDRRPDRKEAQSDDFARSWLPVRQRLEGQITIRF